MDILKFLVTKSCITFYIVKTRWLWTFAWNSLHTSILVPRWVLILLEQSGHIWPMEVSVCLASGRTWKVQTDASSTVQCLKLEIQESLGSPSHLFVGRGSNLHTNAWYICIQQTVAIVLKGPTPSVQSKWKNQRDAMDQVHSILMNGVIFACVIIRVIIFATLPISTRNW